MIFPIYNHKITKTYQYKYVYNGKKFSTNNFIIFYRVNNQEMAYFGISINRKVGNSVRRHKIKRWILEALKLTGYEFPSNYNYTFLIKKENQLNCFQDVIDDIYLIINKIKKNI